MSVNNYNICKKGIDFDFAINNQLINQGIIKENQSIIKKKSRNNQESIIKESKNQ